jgi:dihydroxyacetone kinase
MKKLINSPRQVVPEMLEGVVAVTPGLALLESEEQGVAFMLENLNFQADHPRAPVRTRP